MKEEINPAISSQDFSCRLLQQKLIAFRASLEQLKNKDKKDE
jgi:hypothetical protein